MDHQKDRVIGCLVGLAVGDALGTTVEFRAPGTFPLMTDIVGGGPFDLEPGQWTDDTSMALCLAESLLECDVMNLQDQAERYVRWWREGHLSATGHCFDIGNTVSGALRNFEKTGVAKSGSTSPNSAGNGSIMRLAPVPMICATAEQAIEWSAESSRTTHQASAAVDACKYLGGILWALMEGASKQEVLAKFFKPEGESWTGLNEKIAEIAAGSFREKEPPQIRGSGYVVDSLEAALWAFERSNSFEEGALLAVNLGNDADTTGAVYGQIAGAFYGDHGIPEKWRDIVYGREMILNFAEKIFEKRITGKKNT